ncbi:hypothetical protein NPX13_g2557 [Xylaria arbuscula]|uniref:Uncharacterized protein n=1 Tax=Xylaria arbuscula TaxID=114810 RepID=A0A9W8NK67_9PEZI|nr:hypothetical protein NPX13_g2557 [Xylaria arbuscula]
MSRPQNRQLALTEPLSLTIRWEFTVSRSLGDTILDACRLPEDSSNARLFRRLVYRVLEMANEVQRMLPGDPPIQVGFLNTRRCPTIIMWIDIAQNHLPVNTTVLFTKMEELVEGMRRIDALELPKTFRIVWLTRKTRPKLDATGDWESGQEMVERKWKLGDDHFGYFDLDGFLTHGR